MADNQQIANFALPFLWGLVILASWIGWGEIVSRFITGSKRDAGIRAGWGMCLMIFFGGILNQWNLCSIWTVGTLVAIGAIIFLFNIFHRAPSHPQSAIGNRQSAILPQLPLLLLATLIYAGSVCWRFNWNASDDFLAYLVYPIKMLQSGAAHDPFSWRRLSTLGGYSFLEATVALVAKPQNTFLLDIGLGGILNCLLTVPVLRRAGASPLLSSLGGIICLTLPLGRVNSMSYCLGMAGFLLLFRTVDLLSNCPPNQRRRLCWVTGSVASALVTIRPNFLPVAALTLLLSELLRIMRGKIKPTVACVELGHMMIGGLIFIAPWSIALNAATGSHFYPLFKGNQQTAVDVFSSHLSGLAMLKFIIGFFLRPKMLALIALGLIALGVSDIPATALWLAAVVGAALVVSRFTSSDYANLSRYTLPSLAAATIAAWIATQFEPAGTFVAKLGRVLLIGVAGVLIIFSSISHAGVIRSSIKSLQLALLKNEPFNGNQKAPLYTAAQARIPASATILTLVDDPFLLNYRRNTIYSADWPGMASPPPGIPFFQGSQALARYLQSQSIDYVMCENFDADEAMYSRNLYLPGGSNDIIVNLTAARALNLFQNLDDLAANSPLVFDQDGLRIIRIR